LVLLNGSALAVNWENEHIPAIVEAWYPGQAAGQAIADVLFGDYNPGGRLPVTFYKSVNDLPSFDQYKISNQTYRYYQGVPLYPFGYGLSYTTFDYKDLSTKKNSSGDSLLVTVNVRNTGSIPGDEVVQAYAYPSDNKPSSEVPLRSLVAFERINLQPNQTKPVRFVIPIKRLKSIFPGNVPLALSVGGGQPNVLVKTTSSVKKTILQ
jgi:beta-glucosidase